FYIGFILFIFFHLPVGAQKYAPTGILNSYTYTEKDGLDNYNYLNTFISSTGKVYTSPYGSFQILVIGNNYTRTINGYEKNALDILSGFTEAKNGDIFIYQRSQVDILRNDTIIRRIKYPTDVVIGNILNTNYLQSANGKSLYHFDGFQFTKVFNINKDHESEYLTTFTYKDSVFAYYFSNSAVHVYSINRHHQARFVISLKNHSDENVFATLYKSANGWALFNNKRVWFYKDQYEPYKTFPVSQILCFTANSNRNQALTIDGSPKFIYLVEADTIVPSGKIEITGKSKVFVPDAGLNNKAWYAYGGMQPARSFSYLKKYPSIFGKANSIEIFSLAQDNKNRIWAASYQSKLSIVDYETITEVPVDNLHFLNGNLVAGNKLLFFAEGNSLYTLLFDQEGKTEKKLANFGGFIAYLMPNKKDIYLGMSQFQGLWHTDITSLASGKPKWGKIGKAKGVSFQNIVSITSDTLDRIWYGHRGVGVYYPKTDSAVTFNSGNEVNYFVVSLQTDPYGTVWLGSAENGLFYYDGYTNTVKPSDIKRLLHSLLPDKSCISSLCVWGKWLVIGIENRILLLDLQSWHKDKTILIRYLNPQEAAFTSKVEQNIFLIDKRDSSLWFSTSDMLYQWDIKTWVSLPVYKVSPNLVMRNGKNEFSLSVNQQVKVEPTQNTFSLSVWFQSRDNMPRYISAALTSEGDTISFPNPSLQTQFDFSNLAPGTYFFSIRIFQSDGTTSSHTYTITVKKFWWQYVWVWLLFALIVLAPIILWLNGLRKTALLQKIKAEQDSKLANLQLVSLSSQFRPHFILNALNAIGAGSDDKPDQESILSRLGESVNLIFNHAKEQKTTHTFSNEWKLAVNVIEIHRLMYLKELQLRLP
ncbi:MAG: histidine kinase, partial [Bacteroidales bacterium]